MQQQSLPPDLLTAQCVDLDLRGRDKHDVLRELVGLLWRAHRIDDADEFLAAVEAREATGSTGLEQGVAIPHARAGCVPGAAIAFGIHRDGVDFGAADGMPSRIFLLIAEPAVGESDHLEILARASSRLIEPNFRERLLSADSAGKIVEQFVAVFGTDPAPAARNDKPRVVVAVTSCPVGVSHTYLAAERLREAAAARGIDLRVETQGSDGVRGRLSADDIAAASGVILAVDRKVDTRRFAGKPLLETWVTDAIRHPDELLARVTDEADGNLSPRGRSLLRAAPIRVVGDVYRHVMYGFSTILPFVIGGGILLSLAPMFDFAEPLSGAAGWLQRLGGDGAMALLAPILAGFTARSIAGRIGLMPGAVGGLLMAQAGAGLLGGMLAGLIGGYGMRAVVRAFAAIPAKLDTIKAVLLLPLFGLLAGGGLSLALSGPAASAHAAVGGALHALDVPGLVLLGAVLGAMMAIDLGGPVNKIAYSFGIVAIGMEYYPAMAALLAAGMVPPLGIGAAAWCAARDDEERRRARRCLFKGASFVTEGVIPMLRGGSRAAIGAGVAGAALCGALTMLYGCELRVPHGGLLVTPLVGNWPMFLLAIAAGTLLTAALAWISRSAGARRQP